MKQVPVNVELKPCPFCGSTNVKLELEKDEGLYKYSINCWDCYSFFGSLEQGEERISKAWNRRTPNE